MGGTGPSAGASRRPCTSEGGSTPPQACQNTILAATVRRVRHKLRGNAIPRIGGNSQRQLRTIPTDPREMPAGIGASGSPNRKTRVWPCRIRCGHGQNVQDRTEHARESLKNCRTNSNWTEPDALPAYDIDGFGHPQHMGVTRTTLRVRLYTQLGNFVRWNEEQDTGAGAFHLWKISKCRILKALKT